MSQRVYRHFTKLEQAELWKRWHQGESLGEIARGLGRHDSVIQTYFAKRGGLEPRKRTRRSNALTVEEREEKISGWLEVKFSTSSRMYVSHETIYRTLAHSSPRRAQGLEEQPDRYAGRTELAVHYPREDAQPGPCRGSSSPRKADRQTARSPSPRETPRAIRGSLLP